MTISSDVKGSIADSERSIDNYRTHAFSFSIMFLHFTAGMSVHISPEDNNGGTYPKVRRSKSVRSGRSGCGGGGGMCKVSIDISEQVAHHGWHTRTHVFG